MPAARCFVFWALNHGLLDILNGDIAGHWDALDDALVYVAKYALYVQVAIIGCFGLVELVRTPKRGLYDGVRSGALLAVTGVLLLVASHAITEARPFVTDRDTIQLLAHAPDNGFPSDHAAAAAAFGIAAALLWRRQRWLFLGLAAAVSLSRVFVGVHYPSDIAASWLIAAAGAAIAWPGISALGDRLGLRPPAPGNAGASVRTAS